MDDLHIPPEVVEAAKIAVDAVEMKGQGHKLYLEQVIRAAITAALKAWVESGVAKKERMKGEMFGNEWVWASDGCMGSFAVLIIRTEAP